MSSPAMRNAMTVDVEDWFQVQAFASVIARDAWEGLDRRVEFGADRVVLGRLTCGHLRQAVRLQPAR